MVDIGSMNERNEPSNKGDGDQSLLEDFSAHQQDLLELAEQITAACQGSSKLRSSSSRFACQSQCNNHLCCFEEDEEYSCKDDGTKDCGVYAGCVALIDESWIWKMVQPFIKKANSLADWHFQLDFSDAPCLSLRYRVVLLPR